MEKLVFNKRGITHDVFLLDVDVFLISQDPCELYLEYRKGYFEESPNLRVALNLRDVFKERFPIS
jgi:hypothetical protein